VKDRAVRGQQETMIHHIALHAKTGVEMIPKTRRTLSTKSGLPPESSLAIGQLLLPMNSPRKRVLSLCPYLVVVFFISGAGFRTLFHIPSDFSSFTSHSTTAVSQLYFVQNLQPTLWSSSLAKVVKRLVGEPTASDRESSSRGSSKIHNSEWGCPRRRIFIARYTGTALTDAAEPKRTQPIRPSPGSRIARKPHQPLLLPLPQAPSPPCSPKRLSLSNIASNSFCACSFAYCLSASSAP
jgi:hypothetical protein